MFSDVSLMPHAVCWAAAPRLIWTMVVTNTITFLSYASICITLLLLARRTRRVIARDWAYFVVGFALFIVACGSTHLLEVITTWTPIFWVDAWTNIITAALSAWVAFMLFRRAHAIGFGVNDYAARLGNTEREKRQMQESLLAAQRLEDWSRMSTVLAHEISNPLEAVQNTLYLIRTTDGVRGEVDQLARMAEDEIARVMDISRSTLSFFRQTAEPELVDLRAASESVRFLVAPLLMKQQIDLQVTSHGNVTIRALHGEIRQVLLNLVRNACEATIHRGAHVSIDLTEARGGVEIAVADQGTGIDPSIMPRLFEFGASSKGDQGNGMGLWTVKHILSKRGGNIGVNSTPGQGTQFKLWWPRTFSDQSEAVLVLASAQTPEGVPA
jgi:signal transduction histidine kinase